MSWRTQGITGTNNIPLGPRRRLGGDADTPTPPPAAPLQHPMAMAMVVAANASAEKRRNRFEDPPADVPAESSDQKPRKKRSRWGDDTSKIHLPGVPTVLPQGMNALQIEEFIIHARLEEIGRKLRTGDVVPPEKDRSPSPEPQYGPQGQRVNTREVRYRKKLEDERHRIVDEAFRKIPGFVPPVDYKKPTKAAEKYFLPAKEFPEINFIGLLIGPRGNTLKKMESESGAKISIRGKGSVKEGKSRVDGQLAPGEEEDLHCLVVAPTESQVKAAIKMIEKVVETAATVPEAQNELKRLQLRELAALNGTLRDDESQICQNCGATGHRKFDCPDAKNFTATLICRICGGAGHVAADCNDRNNPQALQAASYRESRIDDEYANLMAEIGDKRPASSSTSSSAWQVPPPPGQAYGAAAPWGAMPAAMAPGMPSVIPGYPAIQPNAWAAAAPAWVPPPPAPMAQGYYPPPPAWMPPPPPPPAETAPPPPPPE